MCQVTINVTVPVYGCDRLSEPLTLLSVVQTSTTFQAPNCTSPGTGVMVPVTVGVLSTPHENGSDHARPLRAGELREIWTRYWVVPGTMVIGRENGIEVVPLTVTD